MNTIANDLEFSNANGSSIDKVENNEVNIDDIDEWYKIITQLATDKIWGLEFGSKSKACEFYQTYAKCHSFVVKKDDISHDLKGIIMMCQLICNKEELRNKKHFTKLNRIREHKPITWTKCLARLHVHLDYRMSKWKVVAFEESHNHEVKLAQYVHLIVAYRSMSNADKAQVDSLHLYGVRTWHMMGLKLR